MITPTLIIAIVVPIVVVALNAWINFHLKFAPSAEEAVQRLKHSGIQIAFLINGAFGIVWNAYALIRQVSSDAPVTRASVVLIVLHSHLILIMVWMLFWYLFEWKWLVSVLEGSLDLHREAAKSMDSLTRVTEGIGYALIDRLPPSDAQPDTKQKRDPPPTA
jgi:hypothetical protein